MGLQRIRHDSVTEQRWSQWTASRESSPTSTHGQIQGLPVGEDPPEGPGGLEGPFSPGHTLSLPVWGLRGENQVDTEVKRRQWVPAKETWTSEGLEDHIAHSIWSTDRHHREGIQTYIRGLTDSFLKLEAVGWRKEHKCSPETPGGQSDLDSFRLCPSWNVGFPPAQLTGAFRGQPPVSGRCSDPGALGRAPHPAHAALSKGTGAPRALF